jgi:hypothetical protein
MKKLILIILTAILIGCGVTKKYSWENIGTSAGLIIESCRDTLNKYQLDSACIVNRISTDLNKWSLMTHYNSREDYIKQWIYNRPDTVYTITAEDNKYIFTIRVNKPVDK